MVKKLTLIEEINIARDFENNPENYTLEVVDKLDCTNCCFNNCNIVCNQVNCVQITNEKGNFFIVKKNK
jgi:hypothetical protein